MFFKNFRNFEILIQENRRITDIKVFNSENQINDTICYQKPCPGIMLATPNGCVCGCGNDFDLNASGTHCLPQTSVTSPCGNGKNFFKQIVILFICLLNMFFFRSAMLDQFMCPSTLDCIDAHLTCDGGL